MSSGGDPYNTADSPRGFVRKYFDIEPALNAWMQAKCNANRITMRAYIRALILQDKQETERGKGKGKRSAD